MKHKKIDVWQGNFKSFSETLNADNYNALTSFYIKEKISTNIHFLQ